MRSPRRLVAYGSDTAFIDPLIYIYIFIIYKRSFYQDRLGTSIGKFDERGVFCRVSGQCLMIGQPYVGQVRNETIWFLNFLISKPITCQDRLGTNVTKCAETERRDRFVHGCHRQEYGGGFVYEGDHTGGEIRTAAESAHPPWQDDAIMVTNHNMVQKNRPSPHFVS